MFLSPVFNQFTLASCSQYLSSLSMSILRCRLISIKSANVSSKLSRPSNSSSLLVKTFTYLPYIILVLSAQACIRKVSVESRSKKPPELSSYNLFISPYMNHLKLAMLQNVIVSSFFSSWNIMLRLNKQGTMIREWER